MTMATIAHETAYSHTHNLGVLRFALTGALAAGIFYVLCWVGARFVPSLGPAGHKYLTLFTNADPTSGTALVVGACWSIGFGLIMGALIALVYNALAFLDRQ